MQRAYSASWWVTWLMVSGGFLAFVGFLLLAYAVSVYSIGFQPVMPPMTQLPSAFLVAEAGYVLIGLGILLGFVGIAVIARLSGPGIAGSYRG